jgi:hypothetical protein
MASPVIKQQSVKWQPPFVVLGAAVTAALILLFSSPDLGNIANLLLVVPVAGVSMTVLFFRARARTRLICFVLMCSYALANWQLAKHWEDTRSELRWLIDPGSWKAKVMQQPVRADSGIRCAIWDGWGFAGEDTDVYLIYSPNDGLLNYSPSTLNGLPQPVSHVQRLERQWYSVTFYTDQGWDGCKYL